MLYSAQQVHICPLATAAEQQHSTQSSSRYLYAPLFIPVQRDTAQVQDGRCGEQDIEGRSDQAEHLPIDPVVLDQLNGSKRHHQQRHQQVRKGKGNDEIIGLDFPVREITKLGWNNFSAV